MNLYSKYILPHLIDLAMRNPEVTRQRAKIIPPLRGAVLEVGIGSGLNLRFYSPHVTRLYALEPSPELLRMARPKAANIPFPVDFLNESAQQISLADQTVDNVVVTWVLCSIPDPLRALREMKRVLSPEGKLVFIEHGLASDVAVRVWQNRLNPLWQRMAGGCHLNRKIDDLIGSAGFELASLETLYLAGPRPLTYTYYGIGLPM